MWHRFDEDLKHAILRASQTTASEGGLLTTRHLLTQLIAENTVVSEILHRLGVAPGTIRGELARMDDSETRGDDSESALTSAARSAVERSYTIAAELGDAAIGGEHLLLALVRVPEDSDAGRALARQGVDWEAAGRALMALQKRRLCPPRGVRVPGLRTRRVKRRLRGVAGRVKHLIYAAAHFREPFLPYVFARKRTERTPYRFYARLRRRPVYWDSLVGQWVVTGYEDVVAALAEPRLSQRIFSTSACEPEGLPAHVQREFRCLQGGLDRQMLFLDAPEQTRQRSLLARRFTPRVIAGMRGQMQQTLDELLDAAPAGGMEVIAGLAVPFPLTVILRMLDLPPGQMPRFKKWSADYFTYLTFDTTLAQDLAAHQSVREATAYFRDLIAERRLTPPGDPLASDGDLLALLLQADAQGEYLPEEEVIANCLMLLATGHENTTRIIGNGLIALLHWPDQWQRLRENPSLIGPAVEELLRYDSPVQWTLRHLPEDLEWRGQSLKKGQRVQIGLAAANRDPARFPEPDRLDLTRTDNRHVAFGHGPHFCLGAALARMEAEIVLGTLTTRFPRLRLERPPVPLLGGLAFRGPQSLHIRWD